MDNRNSIFDVPQFQNANVIRLDREVSSVKVTVVSANVRIKWLAGHVTNALKVPTDSTFLMAVSVSFCNTFLSCMEFSLSVNYRQGRKIFRLDLLGFVL